MTGIGKIEIAIVIIHCVSLNGTTSNIFANAGTTTTIAWTNIPKTKLPTRYLISKSPASKIDFSYYTFILCINSKNPIDKNAIVLATSSV